MRKKHTWAVQIQTEDGQTATERVEAYWDPGHILTGQSVTAAACAQVFKATGLKSVALTMSLLDQPEALPAAA